MLTDISKKYPTKSQRKRLLDNAMGFLAHGQGKSFDDIKDDEETAVAPVVTAVAVVLRPDSKGAEIRQAVTEALAKPGAGIAISCVWHGTRVALPSKLINSAISQNILDSLHDVEKGPIWQSVWSSKIRSECEDVSSVSH
jgi:hypothetical protein